MDFLQELVGLDEAKKKKACCKRCAKKATKEMYEELHMSQDVAASLAKIFGEPLNESKGGHKKSFHIKHDLEHPIVPKLAKALGMHDNGHPIKLAPGLFGTYLYGAGLSFYHDLDHIPHEDDEAFPDTADE